MIAACGVLALGTALSREAFSVLMAAAFLFSIGLTAVFTLSGDIIVGLAPSAWHPRNGPALPPPLPRRAQNWAGRLGSLFWVVSWLACIAVTSKRFCWRRF